jgi:hypothetical protein
MLPVNFRCSLAPPKIRPIHFLLNFRCSLAPPKIRPIHFLFDFRCSLAPPKIRPIHFLSSCNGEEGHTRLNDETSKVPGQASESRKRLAIRLKQLLVEPFGLQL